MPFPKLTTCLICENVRPEPGGKFTLLGLFGVSPDVTIFIADFQAPVSLGFLVFSEAAQEDASYTLSLSLVRVSGADAPQVPKGDLEFKAKAGNRNAIAITMPMVKFAGPGKFEFHVDIEAQHFVAAFSVEQGNSPA